MLGDVVSRASAALSGLLALILVVVIAMTLAGPVHAQNGGGQSAIAEALFQEGRKLFDAGKYAAACPKFAESQKLEPKQGTLLNLAVCHEAEGKTASAWAEFKSAATLAKQAGRKDRAEFASERAEALEAKLSRLSINYAGDPLGVVVKIDGNAYTLQMLTVALPVDPGEHEVVVEAPSKKPFRVVVDVAPGPVTVPVDVPALQSAVAQPPPPPPPGPTPTPTPTPDPDTGDSAEGGISPLVYVGFGLAGAGLILGAIAGGLTLSKSSEIGDACPDDQCTPDQQDAIDEAETMANVSNVGFALAGVGAIVGVVGIVLSLGDGEEANETGWSPVISPTGFGVRGRF